MSRSLAPRARRRGNAAGFIESDIPSSRQHASAFNGHHARARQNASNRLFVSCKAGTAVDQHEPIGSDVPKSFAIQPDVLVWLSLTGARRIQRLPNICHHLATALKLRDAKKFLISAGTFGSILGT